MSSDNTRNGGTVTWWGGHMVGRSHGGPVTWWAGHMVGQSAIEGLKGTNQKDHSVTNEG